MKIGITTDCSSAIEYSSFKHNIKVTRTTIHFGDKEYIDGVDLNAEGFYKKLAETDIVPTTSAPSPQELISKAEEWKKEGCTDVIHFPISFKLSAYGENLEAVSDDYVDGINYHVFDCHSACQPEAYCAHYAEILANKGYTVEQIFAACQKLTDNACEYFVVDDLKYLVKNGRLNAASGFIGSLVKIKPILCLGKSGKIDVYEKVRTRNRAIERTIDIVREQTKDAKKVIYLIQHSNCDDDAKALKERLESEFTNGVKFDVAIVPPTIGAHIGGGIISIGYIILDGLEHSDELIK